MFNVMDNIPNIDERFEDLISQYSRMISEIKYSFISAVMNWENEQRIKVMDLDEFVFSCEKAEEMFQILNPKIMRKTMKCVFFGETSVGKSTLINAILKRPILPMSLGRTTKCFVEIKSSPDNIDYLVVDNERKPINLLCDLCDYKSENSLPVGSHIDVFCKSETFANIGEDTILIDTFGINTCEMMDDYVENYCRDADLSILVVISSHWICETTRQFIKRLKTCLGTLNLAIVVNYWDLIDDDEDEEKVRLHFLNDAMGILENVLCYSAEDAKTRIHFMSARDQICGQINYQTIFQRPTSYGRELRKEAFDIFMSFIKNQMEKSSFSRRFSYLHQIWLTLTRLVQQCRSFRSALKNKIKETSDQIICNLGGIRELEKDIKTSITSIFQQAYYEFIEKAVEIVRKGIDLEERRESNRLAEGVDQNELLDERNQNNFLNSKIKEVLDEIMRKNKNILKGDIKEFVRKTHDEHLSDMIRVVEELYFPLYLERISVDYEDRFIDNFLEIVKKIRICTGVTIGFTTFVGIATGGVGFAIAGAIELAIGVGVASAVAGAAVAGGTSSALVRHIKTPFPFVWANDVQEIKSSWEKFQAALSRSYSAFLSEIYGHLLNTANPLLAELDKIEDGLKDTIKNIEDF